MKEDGNKSLLSPERKALVTELTELARKLRIRSLALNGRTLHPGAALSSAEIVAVLFYYALRLNPSDPSWEDRDYFINSRGHGAEPVYVAMADRGFFPSDDLNHLEERGSHLHGLTATGN